MASNLGAACRNWGERCSLFVLAFAVWGFGGLMTYPVLHG